MQVAARLVGVEPVQRQVLNRAEALLEPGDLVAQVVAPGHDDPGLGKPPRERGEFPDEGVIRARGVGAADVSDHLERVEHDHDPAGDRRRREHGKEFAAHGVTQALALVLAVVAELARDRRLDGELGQQQPGALAAVLLEEVVEHRLVELLVELVGDFEEDEPRLTQHVTELREVEVDECARQPARLGNRTAGDQLVQVHRLAHTAGAEELQPVRGVLVEEAIERCFSAARWQEPRCLPVPLTPERPRDEVALEAVLLGDQLPAAERAAGMDEIEQRLAGRRVEARVGLREELTQERDRLRWPGDDELVQLVTAAAALTKVLGEAKAELSEGRRDLAAGCEARERRLARLTAQPVRPLAAGDRAHVWGRHDLLEGHVRTTFTQYLEDLDVERAYPGAAIEHAGDLPGHLPAEERVDRPRGLEPFQQFLGRRHLTLPKTFRRSSKVSGFKDPYQRSMTGAKSSRSDDHASWYRKYWRTRTGISHASNGLSITPYPGVMPTRRSSTPSPASISPTRAFLLSTIGWISFGKTSFAEFPGIDGLGVVERDQQSGLSQRRQDL